MKKLIQAILKGLVAAGFTTEVITSIMEVINNATKEVAKKEKESQLQVEITNKDNSKEVVKMSSALNKIAYSKFKKLYKDATPNEKKQVDEVAKKLTSDEGVTLGHRTMKVVKHE